MGGHNGRQKEAATSHNRFSVQVQVQRSNSEVVKQQNSLYIFTKFSELSLGVLKNPKFKMNQLNEIWGEIGRRRYHSNGICPLQIYITRGDEENC
jgi:hypothetical protein